MISRRKADLSMHNAQCTIMVRAARGIVKAAAPPISNYELMFVFVNTERCLNW